MSLLDAARYRLRVLVRPRTFARDLDEEIRFHLSLEAMQGEHLAGGALSADDARFAARRRFGNRTRIQEEARRMAGLGFLDVARQDLRFALRSFRRTPGFTAVAVLTLAVGIGANTAIFSAVDALLLRPLPFSDPARLMKVGLTVPAGLTVPPRGRGPARDDVVWSYPKFVVFRATQAAFSDLALYADRQVTVRGADDAVREWGEVAGARYLPTLGIPPALGRNFLPEEDSHPDGPRVALLADEFWKRRFNAEPSVLGRSLNLDGKPYTIVGVLPPGFRGLSGRAAFWVPLLSEPAADLSEAWNHHFTLVARRKPDVSPEKARAMVRQLGTVVDRAYPHSQIESERWGAKARDLDAVRVDPLVRRSLLILLGAVGLVLLIACANVANLLLVRAAGRRREIAVRLAVGASRARLVRQLLTESLLPAAGGLASVVVARWGVRLLAALDPANALRVERMAGIGAVNLGSVHLDVVAFAFAATLALATGIVFGLVPALQTTRPSLGKELKDDGAGSPASGARGIASRNVLAVLEIAVALVLLAGSGLMMRSLGKLLAVHPGFDAEQVLTLRFNTREGLGRDSLPAFYDQMLERLGALPGVTSVALADQHGAAHPLRRRGARARGDGHLRRHLLRRGAAHA